MQDPFYRQAALRRDRHTAAIRSIDKLAAQAGLPSYAALASALLALAAQACHTVDQTRRLGRKVARSIDAARLECAARDGVELVDGAVDSLEQARQRCVLERRAQDCLSRAQASAARSVASTHRPARGPSTASWLDDASPF